jgi:hypothetical protein
MHVLKLVEARTAATTALALSFILLIAVVILG